MKSVDRKLGPELARAARAVSSIRDLGTFRRFLSLLVHPFYENLGKRRDTGRTCISCTRIRT